MRAIETDGAPAHKGPVPQAIEVDGWVFVSALSGPIRRPGNSQTPLRGRPSSSSPT